MTDLGKEPRVEVGPRPAKMDEHQFVVTGQRLDEGRLRAVDRLPLPPHRREHGDPPRLGRVDHLPAAQGRRLEEPVDPLLHQVVVLVVDVRGAEVGVVSRPQFPGHPVVLVADVLPELLERRPVGAVRPVVLEAGEIPLRGQGRIRVEDRPRIDVHAVAG